MFALLGWYWGFLAIFAIAFRVAYWESRGGWFGDYCAGVLFWGVSLNSFVELHFLLPLLVSLPAGLLWVLEGIAYRRIRRLLPAGVSAPLAIAGVETLRCHFPMGGQPWSCLGSGLIDSFLAPMGSVVGEQGVSFIIALCGGSLFAFVTVARLRHLLAPLIVVLLIWAIGEPPPPAERLVRTLAVQTDTRTNQQSSGLSPREKLRRQSALSAEGLASHPGRELIVWPESGLPMMAVAGSGAGRIRRMLEGELFDQSVEALRQLQQEALAEFLQQTPDPPFLLTGAHVRYPVAATDGDQQMSPHTNELILFDPAGRVARQVRKEKLMPFGESLPFDGNFPGSDAIAEYVQGLIGYDPRSVQIARPGPIVEDGLPILGTALCWDNLFEAVFRRQANGGAGAFIVASNEADFVVGAEMDQMVAASQWRALETGRSILKVGTVGRTVLIDSNGKVVDQLAPGTRGSLGVDLPLTSRTFRTHHMRWGWMLSPGFLVLAIVLALLPRGLIFRGRRSLPRAPGRLGL